MRKLSAILLICLFAFSQYARHLSYLECKIMNILKPVTEQCDCEKISGFENSRGKIPLSPVTHLHIHLDDFFDAPGTISFASLYVYRPANSVHLPADEREGCYTNPWQPPDC